MAIQDKLKKLLAQVDATPGWSVERVPKAGKHHYRITGPNGALGWVGVANDQERKVRNVLTKLKHIGWRPVS